MPTMMTPKQKVGRVVFLSELMAGQRALSSCCVGAEARLDSLTDPLRQRELYALRLFERISGFRHLIGSG